MWWQRPRKGNVEREVNEAKGILNKLATAWVTARMVDKKLNTERDIESRISLVKHLVDNMKHYKQIDTEQQTKHLFVSTVANHN